MSHTGKACEVAVVGHDIGAMVERQGGEMRVSRQVARRAGVPQQAAEQAGVPGGGMGNHRRRRGQPRFDLSGRLVGGHRAGKDRRACRKPDKGEQRDPRQANRFGPGERGIQPGA